MIFILKSLTYSFVLRNLNIKRFEMLKPNEESKHIPENQLSEDKFLTEKQRILIEYHFAVKRSLGFPQSNNPSNNPSNPSNNPNNSNYSNNSANPTPSPHRKA